MANIGELVIALRADIANFRSDMNDAKKSVKDLSSEFSDAQKEVKEFLEAVGAFEAARKIVDFFKEAAEASRNWAEQLSTFQGLAGLSSTAAATLAASTQIAGVQTEIVNTAMARLGTTIATHPQKFQQLGIAIRDSSGQLLPMTDILRNTIGGLDQFKAGTDRAAAAGFLFGKGAEQWITQLDKLGPELKAANWAENEALVKGLGLAMENGKATAEEWARAEGLLKLELLGVENQIGSALLPVLRELGSAVETYAKNGDLKRWAEDAGRAVIGLTIGLAELTDFIASHNQSIGILLGVTGGVAALESPTATGRAAGLAAFAAGWKLTGTGADEAAAKVHVAAQKMIADLKEAQKEIGNTPQNLGAGAGAGEGAGEGTKTFNVPDPALKAFNDEYDKLLSNYSQDLDYQKQLKTAYNQNSDAVRQLQVDHAGELAVYKLLEEAQAKQVDVSDQQLEAARKMAEADETAKLVTDRQKQASEELQAGLKKENDAIDALAASSDSLTEKERKLADTEGLLMQAFDRGLITAQQFQDKLKALEDAFNGPDKGMEEFTKGLSDDFSTLIGKATDFTGMMQEAGRKGGQSIFQQLQTDAEGFIKSLETLLIKLLIINPLLNSLGLGNQGSEGGQLPTLYGTSNTVTGGSAGGIISFLSGLFGGSAAPGAGDANSSAGASLNSGILGSITDLVSGNFFPAFEYGGEFVVGGSGGVDSQLVSFKATPGEKVAVGPNAEREAGAPVIHQIYSPTFITPDVGSFKKTNAQHGADAMRAMRNAGRYA